MKSIEPEKPKRNWTKLILEIMGGVFILLILFLPFMEAPEQQKCNLTKSFMEGAETICNGFVNSTFLTNQTDEGIEYECIVERFTYK